MVCPILTLRSGMLNEGDFGVDDHDRARGFGWDTTGAIVI